jgi:hypothetical protein
MVLPMGDGAPLKAVGNPDKGNGRRAQPAIIHFQQHISCEHQVAKLWLGVPFSGQIPWAEAPPAEKVARAIEPTNTSLSIGPLRGRP